MQYFGSHHPRTSWQQSFKHASIASEPPAVAPLHKLQLAILEFVSMFPMLILKSCPSVEIIRAFKRIINKYIYSQIH